jgi:tetratricopeptide (TPR) repeat protein
MKRRSKASYSSVVILGAFLLFSGCHKAAPIRTSVDSADILRSNELIQEGEAAFIRKEFYAALIKFLYAEKLTPNSGYLQNRLGMAYSQLELYDNAIASFKKAIASNPRYPFPFNNLGAIYFAQNKMKKARNLFQKALEMKDDEASFHLNLGMVYLQKNKLDKARAEISKALQIDPLAISGPNVNLEAGSRTKTDRNYFIARLHASEGRAVPAIESLKKAVANGFSNIEEIKKQADFNPIREDIRFIAFMTELPTLIKSREH